MRNTLVIALVGITCLLSAPEAQGNSAPPDVVIEATSLEASTPQLAMEQGQFVLQAGCCDQGFNIQSATQAPGCCDQGWSTQSSFLSSRTLVAIAAMASLLLAAVSLKRFTFNRTQQWT